MVYNLLLVRFKRTLKHFLLWPFVRGSFENKKIKLRIVLNKTLITVHGSFGKFSLT